MQLIVLSGQMNTGKDELAKCLVEEINWTAIAFADEVKIQFMKTFNVDLDFIEKWKRIDYPPPGFQKTVRESLIFIGDGFRSIKKDIWISLAMQKIKNKTILKDGRYIDEINAVKEKGGISILIYREGYENQIPNDSEQQIMPYLKEIIELNKEGLVNNKLFDIFIKNNGNLNDFKNKINKLIIPYVLAKFPDSTL